MELYEEIKSFSRSYINDAQERTAERRILIARAYKQLTGHKLHTGCSTCYIEAIFTILKKMETKNIDCGYRLKKGARLMAFSDPSKYCDNNNITAELAEWHLANNPGCVIKFEVMPAKEPDKYEAMNYNDIAKLAKQRGLKAVGGKAELIRKLQELDK